jgi:16S rRNA (guanine(966)-N(2))-methyltransferase RsmD
VKESLFNILGERIIGTEVLDLFAGVGSLGIESLSRGAKRAVFVDKGTASVRIVRKNLALLDFHNRAEVYREEAGRAVKWLERRGEEFGLIFIDPPYGSDLAEKTLWNLTESHLIEDKGTVVVEHYRKRIMPAEAGRLKLVRNESYGDTSLSFYKVQTTEHRRQTID